MSSPSPTCTIAGGATPADVTAGGSITGALANPAGVGFWGITCIATDELNTVAAVNATLSVSQGPKTFAFTAPAGLGSACIFQSTVGAAGSTQGHGIDVNGLYHPEYTTTFKVNVPTSGRLRVIVPNETLEQGVWTNELNAAIRTGSGASSSGLFISPVDIAAGSGTLVNNSGSETVGVLFGATQAGHSCTGARFYWDGGATNIKVKLYRGDTGALVTSTTVAVTAAGIYTATFGAAQALTAGLGYSIAMWDTAAAHYTTYTGMSSFMPSASGNGCFLCGPNVQFCGTSTFTGASGSTVGYGVSSAGDVAPLVGSATIFAPIEPLIV